MKQRILACCLALALVCSTSNMIMAISHEETIQESQETKQGVQESTTESDTNGTTSKEQTTTSEEAKDETTTEATTEDGGVTSESTAEDTTATTGTTATAATTAVNPRKEMKGANQVTITLKTQLGNDTQGGFTVGDDEKVVSSAQFSGNPGEDFDEDIDEVEADGYVCLGWSTSPNADVNNEDAFDEDLPETFGTSDQTYYLYFVPDTSASYTVHYVNQGTKEEIVEARDYDGKKINDKITVNAIHINGYQLVSEDPQTVTLTKNENDIYFYYTVKKYAVHYDLDGGTGDIKDRDDVLWKDSGLIPTVIPTKDDATFDHWILSEGGNDLMNGKMVDSNGRYSALAKDDATDSITLKAVYVTDNQISLKGKKLLSSGEDSKDLNADQFKFSLTEGENNDKTGYEGFTGEAFMSAGGAIDFGILTFTKEGTYTFIAMEIVPKEEAQDDVDDTEENTDDDEQDIDENDQDTDDDEQAEEDKNVEASDNDIDLSDYDVRYDLDPVTITVNVTKDENGKLKASATYSSEGGKEDLSFTNELYLPDNGHETTSAGKNPSAGEKRYGSTNVPRTGDNQGTLLYWLTMGLVVGFAGLILQMKKKKIR